MHFFLLFLFFVFFHNVPAMGLELSLEDAVNLALENNLSLKKTEIDLASSGFSERNLWSEIFPTISASASATYRNQLFSGVQPNNQGISYNLGFSVNLGLNAGIPYSMRNIQLAHQANILRYEDARNLLSIQVTKKYFELIAEKNNLTLLEEVFNLAQRQFTRSETLFRNGLVGELSFTQSRISLENARYNHAAALITHQNSKTEFLAMLGMQSNNDILLLGEINILKIDADAEVLINEYLPLRPDIIRNSQEIERLTMTHMQTIMQSRAPSLNLSLDWSSSSFDPFTDILSATARVSIPIDPWIPGTARQQAIARASGSLEKAKLDMEITENAAKAQIRSLTALLRNSYDSIIIARLSLEAARRGYQLTEQGFLNGIVESLTLVDARNNMANARQRLLQTELSYFNMILDLSAALNMDWKILIETYGVPNE